MALTILLAFGIGVGLLLLLARYAEPPSVLRDAFDARAEGIARKPAIDAGRLRAIVSELLAGMGLVIMEAEPLGHDGGTRLVAVGHGALRATRHIIYLEASPPGQMVDGPTLLALAQDVAYSDASLGVVVTPYSIERSAVAGVDVDLELIDGPALLALIRDHLPGRVDELLGYRLAGVDRA